MKALTKPKKTSAEEIKKVSDDAKLDWRCCIADGLTFLRFFVGILLFIGVIQDWSADAAFVLFVLGELTDAFDGAAAKKWPFPADKTPKYRKFAEKYDMWSDTFLITVMFIFEMFRIEFWLAFIVGWILLTAATIIELISYGKFFGHPDDNEPWSLYAKEPEKAEKLLMFRRLGLYIPAIGILVIRAFIATSWSAPVKVTITLFGAILAIFLWKFLKVRREKVARD